MALIHHDWSPYKKTRVINTHREKPREGGGRDWRKASISKGSPGTLGNHQKPGKGHENNSLSWPPEGISPTDTWILDFWLQELWVNKCLFLYFIFFLKTYLLIWLCWVLVAGHGLFNHCCRMWDLDPWPRIKPRSPAPGVWGLSPWTTRLSPQFPVPLCHLVCGPLVWKRTQQPRTKVNEAFFWVFQEWGVWSCAFETLPAGRPHGPCSGVRLWWWVGSGKKDGRRSQLDSSGVLLGGPANENNIVTRFNKQEGLEMADASITLGFPGGSAGKESVCNVKTWVWSLGWEDPLEKGTATHSSILAWRIHILHGVAKSWTRLSGFHSL